MWRSGTLVVLSLVGCCAAGSDDCRGRDTKESNVEHRLLTDLMCGYSDELRPVKDHRTAVNVTVRMALKYITFDSQEETINVHSWLSLRWVDEYLPWNPTNYDSLEEIQIDSYKIWVPELSLYNADPNANMGMYYRTPCVVNYTGEVICVPHVAHIAICTTSLRNWPYDTQNCTLRFGSWMHSGEQINFKHHPFTAVVNKEDFTSGPGWELLSVTYDRTPGKYDCCPNDTYPSLRYHFELRRHAAGYAAIIVAPSVVVVALTLASLLMDVKDNTRLHLACFSLLGHFIYLIEIGHVLPKSSEDTPIILLFVRDSMVLTLVAIILTLVFSRLRQRIDPTYFWISKVNSIFAGPARFAVFTEFEPGLLSDTNNLTDSSAQEARVAASREWTSFCNILNSMAIIVMFVVYFSILMSHLPHRM